MNFKIGIKEVVAMGIGTALFVVLTNVQIPLIVVPNTALQPRMAILAFLSAVFGPIVGLVVGLVGHALGDALFYGSVWWSWVIPDGIVGLAIGFFANKFAVKEGGFVNSKNIILFNIVQVVVNAVAWIICAPVLDILIFAEPANKVFAQGAFAFLGNIVVIGILGTILLVAYSKIAGGSNNLQAED
ncbi:ECF-type riboflavin transporter substrate-binding protein [Butyrivibrio sp. CB08]|uniref:ECF-type riboflavin transporter substrate-binding protein n=1 Tax=Butyrivibrio sp. CB08 TaxID=2364879 RepID=UPI000EA91473|nr:ECF-type riboflavin transporter substrate-binding protein [Butyrivibrio sp. CB08]RKM61191.1 ECF-type riboflavin transporter substrate-binding protein [Butyrivibrio sp. CB08]